MSAPCNSGGGTGNGAADRTVRNAKRSSMALPLDRISDRAFKEPSDVIANVTIAVPGICVPLGLRAAMWRHSRWA